MPQIFLQQGLHHGQIRPVAPQEGSRFEGAGAGPDHKVSRVDHHPRKQGGGFQGVEGDAAALVLEQFRHQFAGGGGIGFQIHQHRILYEFLPAPVVIDHHHPLHFAHQPGFDGEGRLVGVHHDQQGSRARQLEGPFRADDPILQFVMIGHRFHQPFDGRIFVVQHDITRSLLKPNRLQDADRRPHRIHIRFGVAHDQHAFAIPNQIAQGVGNDPGAHPGSLFDGHHFSPEIEHPLSALHHRLIAAPRQRDFQSSLGVLRPFQERLPHGGHTDAQGDGDRIVAGGFPYLV